jgi:hypothetical protein
LIGAFHVPSSGKERALRKACFLRALARAVNRAGDFTAARLPAAYWI